MGTKFSIKCIYSVSTEFIPSVPYRTLPHYTVCDRILKKYYRYIVRYIFRYIVRYIFRYIVRYIFRYIYRYFLPRYKDR